jgi:hypothetical protein
MGLWSLVFLAPAFAWGDITPGGARDGGDQMVKTPMWSCTSLKKDWSVNVALNERELSLTDASGQATRITQLYAQLAPWHQYEEVTSGNWTSGTKGFARTYTHFDGSSGNDFALSIYLEKKTYEVYPARFSVKLGGKIIKGVELTCRLSLPAALPDPVDGVREF